MPYDLIWFLLPVAAASGWWMAARQQRKSQARQSRAVPSDYYTGINYFLNEQPDKAIDVFIRMLELDSDTVEPHLALGNLFRRRGEVDRAIRIHQNLIARPNLDKSQRDQALLELGHDYLQAGLLDRAESLLEELVERDRANLPALRLLMRIYEQEKEWPNAIESARKIETVDSQSLRPVMAQYYCELAADHLKAGVYSEARKMLRRSLAQHPGCARALILHAQMDDRSQRYRAVVKSCRRVLQQSPEYLADVIGMLITAYRHLGRQRELETLIEANIADQPAIHPILLYADYLVATKGARAAVDYLDTYLHRQPSLHGLRRFLLLQMSDQDGVAAHDSGTDYRQSCLDILGRLLENSPLYLCKNCGFSSQQRHWQCPGCHHWESIEAVKGYVPGRENHLMAGLFEHGI